MREFWGYSVFSYEGTIETAKDRDYEFMVPDRLLYGSREAVVEAVVADMNTEAKEWAEDDPDMEFEAVSASDLEWDDRHFNGRKIWLTRREELDQHYMIFQLELAP